jgi:sorting nexin-4
MAVIDQLENFSNVSWHSDGNDPTNLAGSSSSAPVFDDSEPVGTHHPEMEEDPTRIDPGLSGDILDCTVTEPRKESDGTKDAFVSYLVTTNVGSLTRLT